MSLAGICTAAGTVWFAFADLGVAIPRIAEEFSSNFSTLQWANNVFSLVTGALVVAAGKFGDLFGRRRMLQVGVALLAAVSVLTALSPSMVWLISGRGLMGVGAAMILPASLALIPPEFSGRAEIAAFGVWQAVAWGGTTIGPALSGVITDRLGWRWLFWVNLPVAVVTLVVVSATTPESRDPAASKHIDWPGLVSCCLAVCALLYALTEGPSAGWDSPEVLVLFAATAVLTVAWYRIERRVREPLVDLALFKLRTYNGALAANLTMNLAFAGLSFLLVLWLQNARGLNPMQAGLLMLPATLGVFSGIPVGGRLDARTGGRLPSVTGLGVASAGLLLLGRLGTTTSLWFLAVALFVIGLGLGLVSTPVANTAVGDVPTDLVGSAAGVFKMSSMLGGALGVAMLSAFARALTAREAAGAVQSSGLSTAQLSQVRQALVNSRSFREAIESLPPNLKRTVVQVVTEAFTSGVADTMVATAALSAAATAGVFLLWPSCRTASKTAAPPTPPDDQCAQ